MFDPGIKMQRIAGGKFIDMIAHLHLHLPFQHMDKFFPLVLEPDAFMPGAGFHHNAKRF